MAISPLERVSPFLASARDSPVGDVGRKHVEYPQPALPDAWLLNSPEAARLLGVLLKVLVWSFLPSI